MGVDFHIVDKEGNRLKTIEPHQIRGGTYPIPENCNET